MTVRTHAHTDHTTTNHAHVIRSGYRTMAGARRWMDAHTDTAPTGWAYYVAADTDGTDTYGVWCAPVRIDPTDLTRYGVRITTVDAQRSYVGTSDGMGYGAPLTPTYGAPTVPATDDTPTFWPEDTTDADIDPDTGTSYADQADMNDYTTMSDRRGYVIADINHAHAEVTTDDGEIHGLDTMRTGDAPTGPHGMIPGHTYTGTSRNGTDYTSFYDGSIVTRTYDNGITTWADANHMWCADTRNPGDTITYVVAEGTYWHTYARPTDSNRCSSASWPMVATCAHSFGGYGACVAPIGHPHAEHIDANGNKFTGPAMGRYEARTYGPVPPVTYRRVLSRVPMARDTYTTVIRPEYIPLVADYRNIMAALGIPFRTDGAAYADMVRSMPGGYYDPSPMHYGAWADILDAHYAIN